jgi:hypothetical protein
MVVAPDSILQELHVAKLATNDAVLTRICEFARRHQLHRMGDDDAIDREFSAVCRAIWLPQAADGHHWSDM